MTVLNNPPRFFTVEEVARILRVSKPMIYKLIESEQLEATNIGRRVLIAPEKLEFFLHKCKKKQG